MAGERRTSGAPDGECDNIIRALKLVTNLTKGKELGVEVKGFTDSSQERLAEPFGTFFSPDNARALVTMGELARFKEVHKVVLSKFEK